MFAPLLVTSALMTVAPLPESGKKEPALMRIQARADWPYGSADPDKPQKPITLVLRDASELVAATPFNNLDATPQVVEKLATAELAKRLKVESIDWTKQMLIVVTAGTQRTGGFKVDLHAVQDGDKKLLVTWSVTPPDGIATDAFTHPGVVALVGRSNKPAEFNQLKAAKRKINPRESPPREKPEDDAEIEDSPAIVAQSKDQKNGNNDKSPRILARTSARLANSSITIRSVEELVKARGGKEESDQALADTAKQLKVEGIDFKKQMIIVVSGGVQRTGGYSVEVKGLKVKDKILIVEWKLHSPKPGSFVTQALTHPAQTILIERFDGEVRFEPPPPKGIGKKLGGNPE